MKEENFMQAFRDAVKNGRKVFPCDDPMHKCLGITIDGHTITVPRSKIFPVWKEYIDLCNQAWNLDL